MVATVDVAGSVDQIEDVVLPVERQTSQSHGTRLDGDAAPGVTFASLRVLPISMELDAIVEDLAPRLFRYCLGISGQRATAEDICQEALTALVARWRRHGPPDDPGQFAFAIARRRSARWFVRWRRFVGLEFLTQTADGDFEGDVEERMRRRRLRQALAKIPPRDREAILLTAAAGLSGDEASKLLQISLSAFKMRLLRARIRLRKELGEES